MTEAEYKAYLLYLKSIEIMQKAGQNAADSTAMKKYLDEREDYGELEAALDEVKEGKITYVDPENLWEGIL